MPTTIGAFDGAAGPVPCLPCRRRALSAETILETQGLTKEFKGFVAVNNVDLKVRRGHIHALIGPNGAGKTTFFNLLTKFLAPTARHHPLQRARTSRSERPAQIARRGIIRSFQISAVFPHLTVLENVRVAPAAQPGHLVPLLEAARSRCTTCTTARCELLAAGRTCRTSPTN